jgi:hypothetical protein
VAVYANTGFKVDIGTLNGCQQAIFKAMVDSTPRTKETLEPTFLRPGKPTCHSDTAGAECHRLEHDELTLIASTTLAPTDVVVLFSNAFGGIVESMDTMCWASSRSCGKPQVSVGDYPVVTAWTRTHSSLYSSWTTVEYLRWENLPTKKRDASSTASQIIFQIKQVIQRELQK